MSGLIQDIIGFFDQLDIWKADLTGELEDFRLVQFPKPHRPLMGLVHALAQTGGQRTLAQAAHAMQQKTLVHVVSRR